MMTIHLSGRREQVVLSLLRSGKFASADEVLDQALRLVDQRDSEPDEAKGPVSGITPAASARTDRQRESLRRLGRKLDAMPVAAVEDGLSNRDHDQMLYGQ